MKALELYIVIAMAASVPAQAMGLPASAPAPAKPASFAELAAQCAPDVHPETLKAVLTTESAWNPYAIGVVGTSLTRQPTNLVEAVATARDLERQGRNFSMGLGQVNRHNLAQYGESYETIFEPCRNLKAASAILKDCYVRAKVRMEDAQQALRAAFSCYYSGNFQRGFRPDQAGQPSYVQKVVANAGSTVPAVPVVPAIQTQGGDAVPVRPASQAQQRRTSSRPGAGAVAPWVVFGNAEAGQRLPSSDAEPAAGLAPVKARLVKPGSKTPAAPAQQQQDMPFVQFVK